MTGKLYTAKPNSLKNHLSYIRQENVVVLLITRFGFDFNDATRYKQLAPSEELFSKIELFKDKYGESWFDYYKELFLKELNEEDKKQGIDEISRALDSDLDVVLVCYCGDYNKCHRSLVSEHMKSLGYKSTELL